MDARTLAKIHSTNSHKGAFKLRYRECNDGYSLYAEIQNSKHRKKESLNLYISGKSSTYKNDCPIIEIAQSKINEMNVKYSLMQNIDFLSIEKKRNMDFVEYVNGIAHSHNVKSTCKNYHSVIKHLQLFAGQCCIPFNEINTKFCRAFLTYLTRTVSANTGSLYCSIFKRALNLAVEDNIIEKNPAYMKHIKRTDTTREYLTLEEIERIHLSDFPDKNVKNAFIFSCFSGLRFADFSKLTFEDIENDKMIITQTKTRGKLEVPLSNVAIGIIEKQKEITGRKKGLVFELGNYEKYRKSLKLLAQQSMITKNISAHTGRHSFAGLAIKHNVSIYELKELLGHREIRHTLLYAKMTEERLTSAVNNLPVLS